MIDRVGVLDVVLIVVDRRDVIGLPIDHLRNCLIVHVRRVFERIGARADCIACASRPVRMNCDFLSERVRRVVIGICEQRTDCLLCAALFRLGFRARSPFAQPQCMKEQWP